MNLSAKKCLPCEAGTKLFGLGEIKTYLGHLQAGWEVLNNEKIRKEFKFRDFKEAMVFVNKIADLAEEEGHHPDIFVSYSKVVIELWTHAIGGLSENDFILAAKIADIK